MRDNFPVRRFMRKTGTNGQDAAPNLLEKDGEHSPALSSEGHQMLTASEPKMDQRGGAQENLQEAYADTEGTQSHHVAACRPQLSAPSPSQMRMRHFYNSNRPRRGTRNLDEDFQRLRIGSTPQNSSHVDYGHLPFQQPGAYPSIDRNQPPVPPMQPMLQPQPFYPQQQAQMNSAPFLQFPQANNALSYQAVPVYLLNGAGNPQYLFFTTSAQQMCAVIPDAFLRQYAPPQATEHIEPIHFIPVISEMLNPMFEQPLWMGPTGPANAAFTPAEPPLLPQGDGLGTAGFERNRKEWTMAPIDLPGQYSIGECNDPPLQGSSQAFVPELDCLCPPWAVPPQYDGQRLDPPPQDATTESHQDVGEEAEEQAHFPDVDGIGIAGENVSGELPPTGRADAAVQWCTKRDDVRTGRTQLQVASEKEPSDLDNYADRQTKHGAASPVCASGEKSSSSLELDIGGAEKEVASSPTSMLPASDSRAVSPWSSNASTNDSLTCSLASTTCQSNDGHKNWGDRRLYSRVFYNRARRRPNDSPAVGRESQNTPASPRPTLRWRKVDRDYSQGGQRRFSLDYATANRPGQTCDGTNVALASSRNTTPNERNRRANARFNL